MIARLWHGRTRAVDSDAYLDLLQRTGLPGYKTTPGNQGAWVLRRIDGDVCHFYTLSYWVSLDSIAAFAGTDIAVARYYPEDRDYLLEFEPTVTHFELFT
ncbi:MAG: hypothetical protein JNL73_07795 [Anaerolineales bacterium]|nr:hypothetical protein [Anaerolineales bacterium]